MAGITSYFAPRDTKKSVREAIVGLRTQLSIIDKAEAHLHRKVALELTTAKANAVSNKPLATACLKRKRAGEAQLEQLRGSVASGEIEQEIADLISNSSGIDVAGDEELMDELRALEDELLSERLAGAEHVPIHTPDAGGSPSTEYRRPVADRDPEVDEELRQLQAEMAM
ncbi:hypothetical protein B0H17DRAFT_1160721 [Mycena rosella]|uniref:Uncharacterized protein n=1 Tax=Mycena rosella TaxID=1033263 RepID=A0AAD7D9C3_MYCRO|nr:hypothetical protein B0H17DRAFT_1160721 [Mycena rosella]